MIPHALKHSQKLYVLGKMAARTDEKQLLSEEEIDCLFCKRNAEAETRPR